MLRSHLELIAAYGRRLVRDGLVVGTHGNLSIRVGERVAITPSAVPYDEIDADTVCVVDLAGNQLAGSHEASVELPLHLGVYRARSENAIVHAHAPFSTALACVVDEIPAMHHLMAEFGGPVRTARYATPGTEELAAVVLDALSDRTATLLQSHGTLTLGETLESAYLRAVLLESLARIHWLAAAVREPFTLSPAEVERLIRCRRDYAPRRIPSCSTAEAARESDVALLTSATTDGTLRSPPMPTG